MNPSAQTPPATTARGVILGLQDQQLVLGLEGTEYRLHLKLDQPLQTPVNSLVTGIIRAQARRVDEVHAGGRYIEPVYGRPRRLQGTVISADPTENTLTVRAVCPFVCHLAADQKASDFNQADLVSFDVEPAATFEPT